jgi:hypothetical protein
MKIRKVIVILPLVALSLFVSLSFAGRIAFGHGLGDIVYFGVGWLGFIIYGIYFIVKRKKLARVNLLFPLMAIAFCVWISLEMTIWSGPEARWNGRILSLTEKQRKEITRKKKVTELASLNEQIKKKPNDYDLRMKKGFFLRRNGECQLALDEYKIAYEIDPENERTFREADYAHGLMVWQYEQAYQADTSNYKLKKQIEQLKKNYPFGTEY